MSKEKAEIVWVHPNFKKWLEKVKAKRILKDTPVNNLGTLTEQMMDTPSFKNVEEELINSQLNKGSFVKMDKKRLL